MAKKAVKNSVKIREDTPDPISVPKSFPTTPFASRKPSPELMESPGAIFDQKQTITEFLDTVCFSSREV